MSDIRLQENGSYRTAQNDEPRLVQNSETQELSNFQFVSAGDGISVSEKIK